jgi:hypothetical protein
VLLVALQVFDLLQGAWMTKQFVTPWCCITLGVPLEHSLERSLVEALREENLIKPSLPPPRVCVPPSVVPLNYGMICRYASFDADCSLFLRRPWDYLHAMLGITPPIEKSSLAKQVYDHAPFPYRDLSLAVGKQPQEHRLVVMDEPSPRAFVVYAAQSADYATVLNRLAQGHQIRQSALVESPLADPLPPTNGLAAVPAVIRLFEPNGLLVDVEARTNALLVLAEAWYPGWRAEIDGQPAACLPVNAWMRAVPVPAGRHQVRLYFRPDYLLPGFLISLASLGLLVAAVARRGRPLQSPRGEPEVTRMADGEPSRIAAPAIPMRGNAPPADKALRAGTARGPVVVSRYASKRQSKPLAEGSGSSAWYRPVLRVLAFGVVLVLAGLLIRAERREVRWFRGEKAGADAVVQYQIGVALMEQQRKPEAERRFIEAVRLAEQACRLTEYRDPMQYWTLSGAYASRGRLDKAIDTARSGLAIASATGQDPLADTFKGLLDSYERVRKAQGGGPK